MLPVWDEQMVNYGVRVMVAGAESFCEGAWRDHLRESTGSLTGGREEIRSGL